MSQSCPLPAHTQALRPRVLACRIRQNSAPEYAATVREPGHEFSLSRTYAPSSSFSSPDLRCRPLITPAGHALYRHTDRVASPRYPSEKCAPIFRADCICVWRQATVAHRARGPCRSGGAAISSYSGWIFRPFRAWASISVGAGTR
jgi:hypothetical protein